jgi:hypothetical protein
MVTVSCFVLAKKNKDALQIDGSSILGVWFASPTPPINGLFVWAGCGWLQLAMLLCRKRLLPKERCCFKFYSLATWLIDWL